MQNMQEKLNKKANIIVHSFLFTDMQSSQGFLCRPTTSPYHWHPQLCEKIRKRLYLPVNLMLKLHFAINSEFLKYFIQLLGPEPHQRLIPRPFYTPVHASLSPSLPAIRCHWFMCNRNKTMQISSMVQLDYTVSCPAFYRTLHIIFAISVTVFIIVL